MSRKSSLFIQGLVVVLMLVSLFACQAPATTPTTPTTPAAQVTKLKVAVIGPMQTALGEFGWDAAALTAEQINAAGGIVAGGKKYEFEVKKYDTNEMLSIEDAVSTMGRAINVDKSDFILGGLRTEAVLAMQEPAMDAKKIYIDTGSGSNTQAERVTKNYDRYKYYFKTSFSSGQVATLYILFDADNAASIIKKELGVPIRCAFFVEKTANGEEWLKVLNVAVPKLGYEIVGTWRPGINETDLFAMCSAMQAARPNLIIGTLSGTNGTAFANAYGKLKMPAVYIGSISEGQKMSFWEATGGATNYLTTYDVMARVKINDLTIPYYDAYVKKWGEKPGWTTPFTDAALRILKYAIEKTGSIEADKLIPAMETVDIPVTNGKMIFFPKGHVTAHMGTQSAPTRTKLSYQWVDGKQMSTYPNGAAASPALLDNADAMADWGDLGKIKYEGTVPLKLPPWMVEYWKK